MVMVIVDGHDVREARDSDKGNLDNTLSLEDPDIDVSCSKRLYLYLR